MRRKQITIPQLIGVRNQEELVEGCQKHFKIWVPKVYCEAILFYLTDATFMSTTIFFFSKAFFLKHEASMSRGMCVMMGLSFISGNIQVRQMHSIGKLKPETEKTQEYKQLGSSRNLGKYFQLWNKDQRDSQTIVTHTHKFI